MKWRNLLPALLLLGAAVGVAHADPGTTSGDAVDATPAIKVGEFAISRYLLDKAFQQFTSPMTRRGQAPTPAEVERWFRLYLAQTVIKADHVAQLERAEVRDMTERMARYMLTQPNGPLYRELGGPSRQAFRIERRARVLTQAEFKAMPEAIERLWTALAPVFGRAAMPSEAEVDGMGRMILATYRFDGALREISALDFVHDFQQGIARMAPRDVRTLTAQVEDMAVAEYDFVQAKKMRLDQTPQFLADRWNFALNQVLALYEKEVLWPKVVVSPDELKAYYEANLARYSTPAEITGTLLLFPDLEAARRSFLVGAPEKEASVVHGTTRVIEAFVISREGPSTPLGVPFPLLASMPVGQRCGPFPFQKEFGVFLKRGEGRLVPRPFEEVRPELEQHLRRAGVESLEFEFLSDNVRRVQLCFEFSRYGLAKSPLADSDPSS